MAAAPLRSTFVCTLVLVAGCLNNPQKPAGAVDDAGFGELDAAPMVVPDARLDGPSADGPAAPDGQTPEPPPDGSVPEAGPADALVDLAPDVSTCTPACTEGAKRCGPGGGLQTCVAVNGCAAWGAESSCGDHATCGGSAPSAACACKAAPSCGGAAGTFCDDATHVGTCAKDSMGCVYVVPGTTACPGGQLCGGMAPNGSCGCSNTCAASQVGTYCIDNKTVATCTASNGCYASSGSMTCPGHQTCSGASGSAACKCPATGTAEGTGCSTAGQTLCDANTLLTCTTEAGSGCKLWVKTTDCAALAGGPFQCGTRGGTAACQCPDPNTNIYVDPVSGHDTGTVVPNGANTPAACRYKTITKALTAVTTTRRRIVATTANPPATFSDETFPLALPANVTLDTADATPTPANYIISFDSATAATGISMGDGAVLEGFTVQAASANAAASTISCTAGAITVRRCVLAGAATGSAAAKPATGIAINSASATTCTGTLTNLTIRNYRTGVAVASTSAMGVTTLTDTTLRDNGITTTAGAGLLVRSGKVAATRLTINKSATGTATWGVVLDSGSATVAPSLTATELTIADITRAGLHLLAVGGMAAPLATLTAGDIDAGSASDAGAHVEIGSLTLTGTNVHGSGADGVLVEGGVAVVGPGTKLESNGRDGLRAMAGTVILGGTGTAVSVASNTGVGLSVLGDAGNVTANLKNAAVHDNHDQGLLLRQGTTFTTSASVDGLDVYANNATAARAVGGIFFATSSTLTSFTGNKIHGNTGDEVGFDAQPNGGDTWDLSGALLCTTPNEIYCYTAAGGTSVGLRILDTAPMNTKVNASSTSWTNLIPAKGTDFEFDMAKYDVTAAPACAAVTATCN